MLISLTEALQTSFSSSWGPTSHQSHKKFPHHIPQMVGNIKSFPHHITNRSSSSSQCDTRRWSSGKIILYFSHQITMSPKSNFDCFPPPIKLPQIFSYFAALFSCCWCLITCYCYFCYKVIVYENKVTCIFWNLLLQTII